MALQLPPRRPLARNLETWLNETRSVPYLGQPLTNSSRRILAKRVSGLKSKWEQKLL
jgi:hypothetical protein